MCIFIHFLYICIHKRFLRCNFPCIWYLNWDVPKSTIGVDPFKVPSFALVMWSDNFIFNHNAVNISLLKIISYIPLSETSIWQFHVTIFVALNSGQVRYILTFIFVVILPACVCHCITESSLVLRFLLAL